MLLSRIRSARPATGLGLLAVAISVLVGFFCWDYATRAATRGQEDLYLRKARFYAAARGEQGQDPGALDDLASLWSTAEPDPDDYLVVVAADGRIRAHPLHPEAVGADASANRLTSGATTLGELLAGRDEYVGRYETFHGRPQLAAFAPVPGREEHVGVFRALSSVEADVRGEVYPLALAFLGFCGVVIPISIAGLGLALRRSSTVQAQAEFSLGRLNEVLEQRVHERTSQLEQANLTLQAQDALNRRSQRALALSEERYRQMFERNRAIKLLVDARDGRIVDANDAACEFYGWCRAELLAMRMSDINTLQPEQVQAELERARAGRKSSSEFKHRVASGEVFDVEVHSGPVEEGDRRLLYSIITDITARKRAEQHQELMVRELDHRVKNVLASIQSIVEHTLRSTPDPERFVEALRGRIAAMARVHEALSRRGWIGAGLHDLVSRSTAPYGEGRADRVQVEGEDLELPPKTVLPISMALHELSTNAAKYGALSVPDGRVRIQCERRPTQDGGERVTLSWRELGGPQVRRPVRRGFGTVLIERGVAYELGGEVELDFEPAGVTCTIGFAL